MTLKKAFVSFVVCLFLATLGNAQLDESVLKNLAWRNVGPAGAGGRVVDFAVAGDWPYHIYAATGSGGLFKSTNNGVTWEPIFDRQSSNSIGDVAVDPNNPDVVWVGTGEANARNSVSWGDGVYKSTDGGKTWTNVGLKDSHHIGRIVVDPRNPNTVYVAALGHLWGPNEDRGLFKTTDGGRTWTKTLFIDQDTGFVDVAMDFFDSNTLYAAAYQVRRDGFAGGDPGTGWGPGSGIYKTTDAGRTWKKVIKGLPTGDLGRIGLDVSMSNPNVVYAIVQTPTTAPREGAGGEGGPPPAPTGPKAMKDGGVFRSDDRGESWTWMNPLNPRPFYYSQIRIDPSNENHVFVLGTNYSVSDDGGKNFRTENVNIHVDHHALWIDPKSPKHMLIGNDGGIYATYDGGRTWDFMNQIAISQFYSVDVDMRKPYFIYGGVQDYCSWGGPSATRNSVGITVSDWYKIQTGDGFQARVDPTDYTIIYAESQNGGLIRHDLKSGRNVNIKPRPKYGDPAYRFNWETPIMLSPHDPKTLYVGGNFLFKSTDRGDSWTVISPDLTTDKVGTITGVTESPIRAGVLYAGTDDGNVHVTRDGGKTWTNITDRFPGRSGKRWVSRVVASRFSPGTAYVAFDGHRNDDYATYIYRTTDFGDTWTSIRANLPASEPVRVIREDTKNRNLLFLGTEFAAYVSIDGGGDWTRLMQNLPTVPVADMIVHPRDPDLLAATHGRSLYIVDISPLQQLTETVLSSDAHLFNPRPAVAFNYKVFSDDQFLANKRFVAENPEYGAAIYYYLKEAATADVKLTILDQKGTVLRELAGSKDRGINRIQWDLRYPTPQTDGAAQPGGGFNGPLVGPLVDPGQYTARLTIGDKQQTVSISVEPDPMLQITEQERGRFRTTITNLLRIYADGQSATKTVRTLNDQLAGLSKSLAGLKTVSASLKDTADKLSKQAAELHTKIRRLNGQIGGLYGEVNSSPFAPTPTQTKQLAELSAELDAEISALNSIITTGVPGLETQMNKENVPRMAPIQPLRAKGSSL